MSLFFRRFGENKLDESDVMQRAHELAGFIGDAALHYHRLLKRAGAEVAVVDIQGGHGITGEDLQRIAHWRLNFVS